MATILKPDERKFEENPGKIDGFRIFTDISRARKGIDPKNLNFDIRQLPAGQYSATYHFHRYAEELFVIISGSATLRTPAGLEVVTAGDVIFFEMGETGAHQLYNHMQDDCVFLDIRSFIGYDVCEYPDSDKILLAPTLETFDRNARLNYFDREENVQEKWDQLKSKQEE